MLDQSADIPRPMLAISIHLHRQIVVVQRRVAITRLHRSADAQVERQRNDPGSGGNLPNRVVGRSIVDHQHVAKLRQRSAQTMHQLAN